MTDLSSPVSLATARTSHSRPALLTCTGCSTNSVDVDLGEPGGVVVDDNLHSGDVQAPGGMNHSAGESKGETKADTQHSPCAAQLPVLMGSRPLEDRQAALGLLTLRPHQWQ